MGKLKDMLIDIEEMLMDEMSVDEIANRTGMPVAWILEVKRNLLDESLENIRCGTL
jgi:hypothetical protein